MQNLFLNLVSQGDAPAAILGVVIADGKFACKVRFSRGSNLTAAMPWLKDKFVRWSGCVPEMMIALDNAEDCTIEIKLKTG